MAEQPPLNRSYVISYAANDKDYPIIGIRLDPRVAGYRVPDDLSPHPDSKRYPNHVFTGSQPSNGDERVTHTYEILPSPWVPFTRYDDDLGPIQGRRRSVKNEGQQANLTSSTKTSYEGREGSAIVSNEIEETWSISVDEDGNSLFPLKDRDFYDSSRGAVQERRQLFVPTGDEEGTLENINGVITQKSYEPYNEFLSVKIVQTYRVDGPQLIGKATDNDGQLVTVTTQRKGSDGYIPPSPSATRTVEVNREDAESIVERVVDTPEIFAAKTFSVERPDPIPQKFRVAVPLETDQEIVIGNAKVPVLQDGDISRSEEQRNKFLKRVSSTSRDQTVLPQTLFQKSTDNDRQEVTITETLRVGNTSEKPSATTTIESEALGDGNYVIRKTQVPEVFAGKVFQKTKDDLTPQKFRGAQESNITEESVAGIAASPTLNSGEFSKSEQQVNKFVKRVSTTSRAITQAVTLLESVLTQEGQIGTRTLTLASGGQSFVPSATLVDANVEALGDGRTVKTETRVPRVFDGKTIRKTKIDLTPEKFKSKQEDTTTEESVAGAVSPTITLGVGEFAKSEQQVTEFVKRTSTTSRNVEATSSLVESVVTQEGQLATRTLTLASGNQSIQTNSLLVDGSIEALGDGRTVKTEVKVSSVFDAKQESRQKPEVIPPEFRATITDNTIVTTKQGRDTAVLLEGDEVAKSIQRITEDKIRESITLRAQGPYPSLTESIIDDDGIVITRVKTVVDGNQQIIPSAKTSGQVQALGDGYTLKTQDTKSKVFRGNVFSKEKPDNIPVEFRVDKQASTEEYNEEGNASEVSLTDTEIAKSEQQINEFVKRVRTTTRDDVGDASLSGEQVDQDGVKVTVERQLSKGAQSISPSETVRGEVQNLGGGYTIKTTLTRDEVLELPSFSAEKPDVVPAAFRSQVLTTTEEKTITGDAEEPTLNDEDISKTERQIDKFLKRTTKVSRPETVSGKLVGEQIENDGIKSTVTRTLAEGIQQITPSATVSGNVEDIGDGLTIKTEIVKEKFFQGKSFSKEKPDNIPVEFRAEKPVTIEEFTEEGDVEEVSLANDEISKSEQQVTEFVKRIRKTTRDLTQAVTLEGEQIDEDGVKVIVRRSLSDGAQSVSPSATVRGNVEAVGDGKTIKTELVRDEIFEGQVYSKEKPDNIPVEFRVENQPLVDEKTVEGDVEIPNLEGTELSKSEQQITKFLKRVRTVSRDDVDGITLEGAQVNQEGQVVTVLRSLEKSQQTITPSATVSGNVQNLGGGYTVKTEEKIPEVFRGDVFSAEKSDNIPVEFRAQIPATAEEFSEAGKAAQVSLQPTEISKSEQQVTEFVKRIRKTTRDLVGGVTLSGGQQVDEDGVKVTVTRSLQDGSQDINPTATVRGQVEDIGDGKTIKTELTRAEVFDGQVFSREKPDNIPVEFRVEKQPLVDEKTVQGEVEQPSLEGTDISKSEQQITKFLKRVRKVTRDDLDNITLEGSQVNQEGQVVTVRRSLAKSEQTITPSATLSGNVQNLGGGYTVKTEEEIPKVFRGDVFSQEKPDNVPVEFRAEKPATTKEFSEDGTAAEVNLSNTEISKSEQQVTEFVKRTRTTTRDLVGGVTLGNGRQIDEDGIKVTVTRTLAEGSQEVSPSATVRGSVEDIGDGKTIKTELTRDKVFEGQTYSREKPDNIPVEFRAEKPSLVDEITIEGEVEIPVLEGDELSKSEQQVTEFLKRVRTTTRDNVNTITLEGIEINQTGQRVSIRRTLSKSQQEIEPSAVLSGNIQALGDGYTVKTEQELPEVFDERSISIQQAIQIPDKFLNNETEEESFTEERVDAEPDELGDEGFGVFRSTAQRLTDFTVRKSKTIRSGETSIVEAQSNNNLQKVTVTSEITSSPEPSPLSATTEFSRTSSIGGGKYVKETGTVDNVFDNKSVTVAKPDTIPEKFRVNLPQKRTEEIVPQEQVDELTLSGDEYTKTEQRLTEFTVQKTKVERQSDYEPIQSSELEEKWGISIPYTESIVSSFGNEENCEYDGLGDNKYVKRLYDINELSRKLDDFSAQAPTTTNINLPKILKSVTCVIEKSESIGSDVNFVPYLFGSFGSLSLEDGGNFTSTVSFVPRFDIELQEVWANDIRATLHIFFLRSTQLNVSAISAKCGANGFWPSLKPSTFSKVIYGKSESKSLTVSVNRFHGANPDGFIQRENEKTNYNNSIIPVNLNIPNCIIERDIKIQQEESYEFQDTINIKFASISNNSFTVPESSKQVPFSHNVDFNIDFEIPRNSIIPRSGKYVINSNSEPYKFGYFVVTAITFDAADLDLL